MQVKHNACFAVLLIALPAAAQNEQYVQNFENATIRPDGPRQGLFGDIFFNIEGADNGDFASYGVSRWDVSNAKAAFDADFGAGNWHVVNVELRMTQANSGFTADGPVDIYFSSDDDTDAKTEMSPLAYPFKNDLPVDFIVTYVFVEMENGSEDVIELFDDATIGGDELLAADIESDDTVTLVLLDGETDLAATWAGFGNKASAQPALVITAAGNCPADCSGDGLLAITDFICFQNKWQAQDPYADCNRDGNFDVLDFICYQNLFVEGIFDPNCNP